MDLNIDLLLKKYGLEKPETDDLKVKAEMASLLGLFEEISEASFEDQLKNALNTLIDDYHIPTALLASLSQTTEEEIASLNMDDKKKFQLSVVVYRILLMVRGYEK